MWVGNARWLLPGSTFPFILRVADVATGAHDVAMRERTTVESVIVRLSWQEATRVSGLTNHGA